MAKPEPEIEIIDMGIGPQPWAQLAPDEDAEARRQVRVDAALQAGWVIRQDLVRGEFTAAREMVAARTLDQLLDAIEAED